MPNYDGTGPRGEGPRTGGGFGYCDESRPRRRPLNGRGRRRGYGRRW